MDEALVVVRAIHFASTAVIVGLLVFGTAVADPIFQTKGSRGLGNAFQTRSWRIAWMCLAMSMLSGVAWVGLQAAAMSGLPFAEAISPDVLWVVLSKTQFGIVSDIRLMLAILLAITLTLAHTRFGSGFLASLFAAGFLVGIAWTGHAAGTIGRIGPIHLAADALHLFAAAVWIGGLVPLLLLLRIARQHNDETWAAIASQATQGFSTLGMISVATLLLTGIVNSWILVGSIEGLGRTDYGRLVLAKIGLFGAMTTVAAINRWRLTPLLSDPPQTRSRVLRRLSYNVAIEIALGMSVFVIVGALGTLHPAIHLVPL